MADLPDTIVALAKAALDPIPFYDSRLPASPPERYVVGYFDDGLPEAGNVANTSDGATYRWQFTYAAKGSQATRAAVAVLRRKARAALVDVIPAVPGWQMGPIAIEAQRPTVPDTTVTSSPTLFGVDEFVVMGDRE